jgi:hypothetical protein
MATSMGMAAPSWPIAGTGVLERGQHRLAVVGMGEILHRQADEFGLRAAEEPAHGTVDPQNQPPGSEQRHLGHGLPEGGLHDRPDRQRRVGKIDLRLTRGVAGGHHNAHGSNR